MGVKIKNMNEMKLAGNLLSIFIYIYTLLKNLFFKIHTKKQQIKVKIVEPSF